MFERILNRTSGFFFENKEKVLVVTGVFVVGVSYLIVRGGRIKGDVVEERLGRGRIDVDSDFSTADVSPV